MSETNEKNECRDLRALLAKRWDDRERPPAEGEEIAVNQHLAQCLQCRQWREQTEDLTSTAQAIPQFDVSEGLTQRIMATVQAEQKSQSTVRQMVLMVVVAVAACLFLLLEGDESATGALAWLVGLAGVGLLKPILDAPLPVREAVEPQ